MALFLFCLTFRQGCITGLITYLILAGLKIFTYTVLDGSNWLQAVILCKVVLLVCCSCLLLIAVLQEERISCITMIAFNILIILIELVGWSALYLTEESKTSTVPIWIEAVASIEHLIYATVMMAAYYYFVELRGTYLEVYQRTNISQHSVPITHRTHRVIGV